MKNHKDRDKVLEIRFEDEIVKAGRKLPKGSTLKLIYGIGIYCFRSQLTSLMEFNSWKTDKLNTSMIFQTINFSKIINLQYPVKFIQEMEN